LIVLGSYRELRISDLLILRWKGGLKTNDLLITENKTGKIRGINLHEDVVEMLIRIGGAVNFQSEEYLFKSREV